MNRSVIDKLISYMGIALAAVLLVGGILLSTASTFIKGQVHDQLVVQKITMPSGPALDRLNNPEDKAALEPFAGQMMSTGNQAKAFADHYILNHMNASSNGKTYEEVSGEFMRLPDKTTEEAQKMGELRQSLFMGNTLRGMLLNAYAFGTMANIAGTASIIAYIGAALLSLLAFMGFRHSSQAQTTTATRKPATA